MLAKSGVGVGRKAGWGVTTDRDRDTYLPTLRLALKITQSQIMQEALPILGK